MKNWLWVVALNQCAISYEELAMGCHNHSSVVLSLIFIPTINPLLPKTSVQLNDIKHKKMLGHGKICQLGWKIEFKILI